MAPLLMDLTPVNFFIKSRMVPLCVPIVKRAIAGGVLQRGAGKCGTSHGAEFFCW